MASISHRTVAEAVKRGIERNHPDWPVTLDVQPAKALTVWANGEKILEFGPAEPRFSIKAVV